MINLSQALNCLYPNADPLVDYTVSDDGTGPKIVRWDEVKLGVRPSVETLAAVTEEAAAAAKTAKQIAAAAARLPSMDPTPVAVRVLARVICNRVNAAFAAMGQPKPLLEADVNADIAAGLAAGLGLPQLPE